MRQAVSERCLTNDRQNRDQSNLAKGDNALLSYSPGGSMHRVVCPDG